MSDWVPVDIEEIRTKPDSAPNGVKINLFLSPYDVPEATRGRFDDDRKLFVIEFKYISDEPTRRERVDDFVNIRVGKTSERLHAIEIDVQQLTARTVELRTFVPTVGQAIDALTAHKAHTRDNYKVAKELLGTREDELFADLVAS
jgi:hypothetical protein